MSGQTVPQAKFSQQLVWHLLNATPNLSLPQSKLSVKHFIFIANSVEINFSHCLVGRRKRQKTSRSDFWMSSLTTLWMEKWVFTWENAWQSAARNVCQWLKQIWMDMFYSINTSWHIPICHYHLCWNSHYIDIMNYKLGIFAMK